ncbi:hypothetical protein QQX98_013319 [Neonectria punicea]|uniref:Uncharacterized protein n=1 Tax=Neonectria punicea TaxID=979145 RepID=A0ABR1GGL2_9HYPO
MAAFLAECQDLVNDDKQYHNSDKDPSNKSAAKGTRPRNQSGDANTKSTQPTLSAEEIAERKKNCYKIHGYPNKKTSNKKANWQAAPPSAVPVNVSNAPPSNPTQEPFTSMSSHGTSAAMQFWQEEYDKLMRSLFEILLRECHQQVWANALSDAGQK